MVVAAVSAVLACVVGLAVLSEGALGPHASLCAACGKAYPRIVQSVPVGMQGATNLTSTTDGWVGMIAAAQHNISINAFYVTLTQGAAQWPPSAGGAQGKSVFSAILAAVARGVSVRLIVGWPPIEPMAADDPLTLEKAGVQVRRLNWTAATGLDGVLHSKFMIVDQTSAYIGSANFDWRSLSQVKELGIIISDCPAMTQDLQLVFEQHWYLAAPGATVPPQWDVSFWPLYNKNTPLLMSVNENKVAAWLAVSPPSLCPPTRTRDSTAIIDMVRNANKYLHMSVMDYSPFYLYVTPTTIWPDLDNEIRLAALRGVNVSFILASWAHTAMDTIPYLQSLDVLPNIEVRLLIVPNWTLPNGTSIPYTRVDHSKYMISESGYYITSSNWTPDYFLQTSGISITMMSGSRNWRDLDASFASDWNSPYTVKLLEKYPPLVE